MSEHLSTAIQALQKQFGCPVQVFRGEHSLVVKAGHLFEVAGLLRDKFGFDLLASLTAVDYWPAEAPRFHIIYQFYSIPHNCHLRLRVPLAGENPQVPTIEGLYPNANWHEREIYDMFGIQVEGHPDLRRILMPYEWEGYPLRKDYPLGYEEPQFSFNFEEIDLRKPYVKE